MSDNRTRASQGAYQPGQVGQQVDGMLKAQDAQLGIGGAELRAAARNAALPGKPTIGGPKEMPSELEEFGRSLAEDGPGGVLKSLAKMGLNAFNIATFTGFGFIAHEANAYGFNNALRDFQRKHVNDLEELSRDMSRASRGVRKLADETERLPGYDNEPDKILDKKRYIGDGLIRRIDDAIDRAATPEDRQRLQDLKTKVQDWTGKRDATVKAEANDASDLQLKIDKSGTEARAQGRLFDKAADTMESANGDTLHTSPGALFFAGGMRDALLGARARLTQAMEAKTAHD